MPDTFAQLTDKGKMFFLFQPSGKMEDFFRKAGKKTIETPDNGEKATKLFEKHDLKIVGPPIAILEFKMNDKKRRTPLGGFCKTQSLKVKPLNWTNEAF